MNPKFFDSDTVRASLGFPDCINAMRSTMIALSAGELAGLPRQILQVPNSGMLGLMGGRLAAGAPFGAKIVSVFPGNHARGLESHQGAIVLFDPASGAPRAIIDAGEVTRIRTASASAAATDCLARSDARSMAVLGYGTQAMAHVEAMLCVRDLSAITVWGRDEGKRRGFSARVQQCFGISCHAARDVREAVAEADIICTTTSASEPILLGADLQRGVHVNLVGSGFAGPREVDGELVALSRFFADDRVNVMSQGAEFLHARKAGLVGDDHILAEIGEVMAGTVIGRSSQDDITVYKSLGHIVQDLAAAELLFG
ncbi:ornithine cyclodeaminase family protein [Novosphingobium sp. AP12]|uniref:ornithine cyclodeaminase family protein n=1 Tax=Novosphingobium sp. AP12 TaxID=1144305 RepID=UPI0002720009|nr:ornithine cyclodeaminase family protein [Novosphingobium sp. AP12]EJL30841.1 putative ornithine cyclodeaminase, mu-crystallin [Novosphingobium sp. AP12]